MPRSNLGNAQQAHARALAAANLGHGIDAQETASEAFALAGDLRRAQAIAGELQSRFPQHLPLNVVSLPAIRASIEMQRGNAEKAVRLLREAVPYDLCLFTSLAPAYIRGQAWLRLHDGKAAAAEFRKIL